MGLIDRGRTRLQLGEEPELAELHRLELARAIGNHGTRRCVLRIFKGGTGKTTSSVNTAVALARKGKRVLLVDLDRQASATRYLDLDPEQACSLYEVYMGAKPAARAIKKTKFGVDMLTSNTLLAAIEEALEPGDELKLAEYLNPLKPSYDYILIDTPPGKAMLAFNGLAAAD